MMKQIFATEQQVELMDMILSSVPPLWHGNYDANEIWRSGFNELALNGNQIHEILMQLFIEEATWGLSAWEKMLGLSTNSSLSYEERRGNIKAKIRSNSVVTKGRLIEIANSYKQGTIEIVEKSATYEIEIKFVSSYGTPSNFSDFQNAIREIVPAHLGITYVLKYIKWSEVDTKANTFATVNTKNLTWAQIDNGELIK
jgi:hypothetical protein